MSKKIAKITEKLDAIREDIEQMAEEAQEYYDNRSERWQESDAASEWEEKIEALNDAASSVQDAYDYLIDYAD